MRNLSLLALWMLLHTGAAPLPWQEMEGKAVAIADGDTFTLLDAQKRQHKLRLHGVDAPEKGQPWGSASKTALSQKIWNQKLRVRWKTTDRWRRKIAWIYISDGACVNEVLLQDGAVWHFTKYDKNPVWAALEGGARLAKRGLWSQPNPVAPWLWREAKKK